MDALYRQRGTPQGVRTRATAAVCAVLAALLVLFMISLSLRNTDPKAFLEKRPYVTLLTPDKLDVAMTVPAARLVEGAPLVPVRKDAEKSPFPEDYVKAKPNETRTALVRMKLDLTGLKLPPEHAEDLVVKLPKLWYERARLSVGGVQQGTFLSSDPLYFATRAADLANLALTIDIVVDLTYGQDRGDLGWGEPAFVATHYDYAKYVEFMESRRAMPNIQVGILARVVMAIFALMLFLIVESSPEALGLALFMGFEALAMAGSYADLRRFWVPDSWNITGVSHYCHAMGDVFRLYFYLQLCRLTPPRPLAWLGWASVYAAIYGALRHFNPDFGFPNWATHHVVIRDLLVATAGMVLCVRTALHLGNRNLPWRVGALVLAAIAATAQWLTAAPLYVPFVAEIGRLFPGGGYESFLAIVDANGALLFALSTFVNISTLENRVKVLSREKARAEAMERELELGRSVQRAFLKMPSMPAEIGMSCHYEAAVYVSGDTYFVHWDRQTNVLTFLLNDVTGHGIQAALKAFACNIIARSVWSTRTDEMRLKKYDETVVDLICRDGGEIPDFNAMVGVEFHLDQRRIRLYRVNYNFPVLVEPNFPVGDASAPLPEQAWTASSLTIPNQTVIEADVKEGAFVILISDGFIESARDQRRFVGYLNRALARMGGTLNVNELRQVALMWEQSAKAKAVDDRTLLIFQWNPFLAEGEKAQRNSA